MLATFAVCSCSASRTRPPEDIAGYRVTTAVTASTPMAMIPAEDSFTDSQISDAVYRRFKGDPGIEYHRIYVTTNDGVVQLNGKVTDLLSKERAARVAETVRSVRVVIDRIVLDIPKRNDRQIAQDVANAFLVDVAIDASNLHPSSNEGTVTLDGNVQSLQEKELAGRLAKRVAGVRAIENDIEVRHASLRSDPAIQGDVQARLGWDTAVDDDGIVASVGGGTVYLRGVVGTALERSRAYSDGFVAGARSVDTTGIRVDPSATLRDVRSLDAPRPSDADIAQAIKDAAIYDPRVKSFNIEPSVHDGRITLLGEVDNLEAKAAVESLARHTVGATEVRDEIRAR
ncbi:MAG TPA: BON domain-containing protein [Polyangiaceae bacterium]|nr:BON domain-containing protein [Polyangiaceae bacterium]